MKDDLHINQLQDDTKKGRKEDPKTEYPRVY